MRFVLLREAVRRHKLTADIATVRKPGLLEGPRITHGSSPLRKNSYRVTLPAAEGFSTFSSIPMSFRKS